MFWYVIDKENVVRSDACITEHAAKVVALHTLGRLKLGRVEGLDAKAVDQLFGSLMSKGVRVVHSDNRQQNGKPYSRVRGI